MKKFSKNWIKSKISGEFFSKTKKRFFETKDKFSKGENSVAPIYVIELENIQPTPRC
jgi:hypothetical protein